MRLRLLLCALSGLVATAASAADLADAPRQPVAPAIVSPLPSWAGFYFGAVGAYGWADTKISASDLLRNNVGSLTPSGIEPRGGMLGLTAGYNWQSGNIVYGLEGDYSWSGMRKSTPVTIAYTNALGNIPGSVKADVTEMATLRGRLGYSFERAMVYVTGGYALGRASGRLDANFFGANLSFGDRAYHNGWVIGAGAEMLLTQNWTAKVELLHAQFSRKKYNIGGGNVPVSVGVGVTAVRAGVNYKF